MHNKRGTYSHCTVKADATTGLPDYSIDRGKSESRSAASSFGGKEWLKNSVLNLRSNAYTGIGNQNSHVPPLAKVEITGING